MADILIRGMEMPDCCPDCPFVKLGSYEYILCYLLGEDGNFLSRLPNCPLVEIPTHGDLIDRDAVLSEDILQYVDTLRKSFGESYADVLDVFRNAPVVIPADGKDENKHAKEG